jgi:hypothetical protein
LPQPSQQGGTPIKINLLPNEKEVDVCHELMLQLPIKGLR